MILEEYSYISVPEKSGVLNEDVRQLLRENGMPKTLGHVEEVAMVCAELAEQYGLDREACFTAGMLHDVGAVLRRDDMLDCARKHGLSLCEAELKYPFLLHQRIARGIAEESFAVADERVLSAVECHTTLKRNASMEDMALFLADKLAWDQEGTPPYEEAVRKGMETSLEEACRVYMRYMEDNGRILYPHIWWTEALRWLEEARG